MWGRRRWSRLMGWLVIWGLVVHGLVQSEAPDLEAQARRFVELLKAKRFKAAHEMMNDLLGSVMPPAKLRSILERVERNAGPLRTVERVQTTTEGRFNVVYVTTRFERTVLDIKVVFDPKGRVAGLWFLPSTAELSYTPPPYVDVRAFEEREITIPHPTCPLPGTLTVPKGTGPFPAVVLVHGSGPSDRDETIGPNKPFRDIAWGLATRGVAVLRYEKRTRQCASEIGERITALTVREETVEDAVKAVALLRTTVPIKPQGIFILGHSLGGMLAPRIAAESGHVAGLILLAANSRPLPDIVLDQARYLAQLDGKVDDEEKRQLADLERDVIRIKRLALKEGEVVLGAARAYWADLMAYDPIATIRRLRLPVLILHGGRDYQVTDADLIQWRRGLADLPHVAIRVFPTLNHLMMSGQGPSGPQEYERPGHVDLEVIEAIASWIRSMR